MELDTNSIHGHLNATNAFLTILFLFAISVFHTLFVSPLRNIPGPFPAKFTNLWRLLTVLGRRAEQTHRQMHNDLGAVVRLGPNMVSVSDPAMINEVFSRKKLLRKSELYAANDLNVNGQRVPNLFSTRDEQYSARVMKPVVRIFSMGNVLKMEPLIDQTITFFLQRLDEEFVSTSKRCDMASWLHFCAWDVISETTFSKRMGFLEKGADVEDTVQTGHDAMDYFSVVGTMPWLDNLLDKNPVKSMGPPVFKPATAFCLQRIADRRSGADGYEEASTADFLAGFLEAQKQHPDIVDEGTLLAYLMANVAAGSDTVAVELRSILYHLCKNRDTMIRLQKEIDDAPAENDTDPLSWHTIQTSLPYLCACVEEGIRLMPGICLPLERVVDADGMHISNGNGSGNKQAKDTYLPPGTIVGMSPYVLNRDPGTFGPDAHGFHPERWLHHSDHETEAQHHDRLTRMRAADLTFGAGKRQCAGRHLAVLEVHKVIGSLIRRFDVRLVDEKGEWKTKNCWMMRQSGMDVWVKPRAR